MSSDRSSRPVHEPALRLLRWLVRRLHGFYLALGLFLAIALGLMVGAVWLFAELAELVVEGETKAFDESILLWVHGHESATIDAIALQVTVVGNGPVVAMATLLICSFLWVLRYRLAVLTLVAGMLGAGLLQGVLKLVYQRPRPELFVIATPYSRPISASFPSGHALGATVLYLLVTYLLFRFGARAGIRVAALVFGPAMILAIGMTRIYLGVHYPSDVIAGYLIGLAWAAFCVLGSETAQRLLRRSNDAKPASAETAELEPAETGTR